MVPEQTRSWVTGLALARRGPAPVEVPWGLRVDTGRSRERVRHVLLRTDEAAVRAAAAGAADVPYTWIKAFVAPGQVAAWLGPAWQSGGPEFLMTADLRGSAPQVPGGYAVSAETGDGVTHVRVHTADGEVAAAGYAAVVGAVAVIDRVATDPAHQRRGLGTLVMRALAVSAVEAGARTAVLTATVEGRALYESLGWRMCAQLANFVHRP